MNSLKRRKNSFKIDENVNTSTSQYVHLQLEIRNEDKIPFGNC